MHALKFSRKHSQQSSSAFSRTIINNSGPDYEFSLNMGIFVWVKVNGPFQQGRGLGPHGSDPREKNYPDLELTDKKLYDNFD